MRQDDDLVRAIQEVLGDEIDRLATRHGLDRRPGKLAGGTFARALVFGFLREPDATLDQLAQSAALVAEPVTPQAVDQRFTARAADHLKDCLDAAVRRVLPAPDAATVALLDRFAEVCVQDSTTVALPDECASQYRGCGGTAPTVAKSALKFQVRLDLRRGGLTGFRVEAGRAADVATPLQAEAVVEGSLHLRDLGYFDLAVFRAIVAKKAHFLSRLRQPIAVFDAGRRVVLSAWLDRRSATVDAAVTVGVDDRMPARLVAVRVPRAAWRQRRADLRRQGSKKGYTPSPEREALCGWNVFITSVPSELATAAEILALVRLRWQVELLFKQWKSPGRLDESRSARPERVLGELFAKMLALVVQHWILTRCSWRHANRSLTRAGAAVRGLAGALALAWRNAADLARVLGQIARSLERTGRVDRRRTSPSAFQVAGNPKGNGYKDKGNA